LDRKSGKKCVMLAARSLDIDWDDDEEYWNWTTMPDSRFVLNFSICFYQVYSSRICISV